ncbi:MAG: hypothetical protein H7840_06485 [Alphaproteobacteria bacterium]
MRTITYFRGGTVADFAVGDAQYDDFVERMPGDLRHSETQLGKARRALEHFVLHLDGREAGPLELSAASYVWHFFNTNPDASRRIDGNVIIVDLAGDGETIEYASAADIQISSDE